ncbi:MAG: molybdopterin-dependent oxidoreductase [Gemmataceae bacterium]
MAITLEVRGACPHDCPDTCGFVTEVRDGRAVAFRGDADNPVTRGWLCAKVRPYLDHVYHPGRLLHPLRRAGPKGSGRWQQIPWSAALAEIADRWRAIIATHGAEAILPYSYSGTLGLVQMGVASARFWNRLGASQLNRSICGAAAELAVTATLGARWSPPYSAVAESRLVVLWGTNPVATGPHFLPFLKDAMRRGCKLVAIDPRRTASAAGADLWLAPRPGTDGTLALGIAHLILAEGRHDEGWLAAHTVGWPQLRERIAAFPPERVVAECDVSEADIRRFARMYSETRPGLIKIADGINRNRNGGQNVRAILALPAITGQYGIQGGGLMYSTSGYFPWDRMAVNKQLPTTRSINMNRLGAALCGEVTDPPIASLFVFGANPATSSPNASRIVEGLKREDLFTVVHELFMTDTADYADIVLPATSQLEQTDLHKAYGTTMLTYNAPAIAPLGECMSNWDLMGRLATAMGFNEPWLYQTPDEVIAEVLTATAASTPSFRGITLDGLKAGGAVPLAIGDEPPFAGGRFPTPSGKVELVCDALAAQGCDPLPGRFRTDVDDGGSFGDPATSLTLVTGASHHFVSSSLASQAGLLRNAGPPSVEVNPIDAASRGLKTDDEAIVENARGWVRLRVVVTDSVRPGVLVSPKGRWANLNGGRHVNWTTPDTLADFAGQSTYHSNRVWLRRAD